MVLLVIGLLHIFATSFATGKEGCLLIQDSDCSEIGYNNTILPNKFGHRNRYEARKGLDKVRHFVQNKCSENVHNFFCNLYYPMCSEKGKYFPPCQEFCERTKADCQSNYKGILSWPEDANCDALPRTGAGELCYGPKYKEKCQKDAKFVCPAQMQTPNLYKNHYVFMGEENCGAPCEEDKLLFWTRSQRKTAAVFIGSLSFLCAISTLFTVLTFLIDMKRFHYPERPIVFLSVCYLGVSVAYISGYFLADSVACQRFHTDIICKDQPIEQCPKVVTQGAREAACTILFMLVYFFSMAGSIWWIVLSFTWYLAAGRKWGHEAIEEKSSYFHGVAWTLPAIQTIVVLITSKIEGDVLSGVCFVGIYNTGDLLNFLLVPLSIYLGVGTVFLFAGFYAMYDIRNQVRNDAGNHKVHRLERLMVKIGVFSVLYTVPATVMIACYFYEYFNRNSWQRGWLYNKCQSYSIPCPCEYSADEESKPNFIVFIIKYSMMLIVGITSGFWIWSAKTVESWTLHLVSCDRFLWCTSSRRHRRHQTRHHQHHMVGSAGGGNYDMVTTSSHHHHHHHQHIPLYMAPSSSNGVNGANIDG